ncbi:MAG: hypothetical protein RL563_936 [Pseudomonadota bacterium]|jgi:Kef-type K+ transport system membrane component KefB
MEAQAVHQFFLQLMVILLTARLLFEVGLDTDIRQLAKSGWQALFVAVSGFLWPFVFGFSFSHWLFERSVLESLFIGGTLTATSIGITVRVLTDLKRQHSHEAQVVLGAAVIDDLLGVVLLAVLYDFSLVGQINTANAMQVIGFIALFFVLAPLFAKAISLLIRQFAKVSQTDGLIPTLIVSLVLFFAWLAHEMGAPELLGGFAAGLALSRRFFLPFGMALHEDADFTGRIEAQMRPIIQLFVPIFFVMVGLSLNLREIDWASPFIWWFSASLFAVAILGKMLGVLLLRGALVGTLSNRHRDDSSRRSGLDLCGTRANLRYFEQRHLRGIDHRHCDDHATVTDFIERLLPLPAFSVANSPMQLTMLAGLVHLVM